MYRSITTALCPDHLRAGVVSIAETGGRLSSTLTPVLMATAIGLTTPAVGFISSIQLTGLAVTTAQVRVASSVWSSRTCHHP
jgi:hypothetical protein